MAISLVDSHCHIPMLEIDGGVEAILANASRNNVDRMLCVCIELEAFQPVLDLAERFDCIYASAGVHPNSHPGHAVDMDAIISHADHPRVVAIGETGLDYFRSQGDLDWQRQRFRLHIRAARTVGKPLIIHCREAGPDVISILREEKADEIGGVMHCFVEDMETARQAIDLNFYISFSGIVTFKNAGDLKAVARRIPESSLLVETDSPYLAPVPHRGKQNQPAFVRHVAEYLAELRETDLDHIAAVTTDNFDKLFIK